MFTTPHSKPGKPSTLSLDAVKDPVICTDGHTYERSSIEKWLVRRASSPMTNQPLSRPVVLIPNHALRSIIESFVKVSSHSKPRSWEYNRKLCQGRITAHAHILLMEHDSPHAPCRPSKYPRDVELTRNEIARFRETAKLLAIPILNPCSRAEARWLGCADGKEFRMTPPPSCTSAFNDIDTSIESEKKEVGNGLGARRVRFNSDNDPGAFKYRYQKCTTLAYITGSLNIIILR
jgi:hypothetical protein